jgi:N-acyl-D-aspartate/D-glutamate deacylase
MVAKHFNIKERGEIKEGNYADIAVIDLEAYNFPSPEEIDYRKPLTMASGVDTVLVNGKITLERGQLKKTMAGKVLKRQN